MNTESFEKRHIGPTDIEIDQMLKFINAKSLDDLIDQTIPKSIRSISKMVLDPPMSESDYLMHLKKISSLNKVYKTYIGMGYNRSYLPAVIQRNILENPGWYTAYTPYQAEIAQGRLEALLNFQTMITDLTGMEISNASKKLKRYSTIKGASTAFIVKYVGILMCYDLITWQGV